LPRIDEHDATASCRKESRFVWSHFERLCDQLENEARSPPDPNQGQAIPPFVPQGGDQKLNPSKDKTLKFGYGLVKSQVETPTKKILIIEGFGAQGSVDLDSLTNFP